jgi:prolyl-tRNA synthetase
MTKKETFNISKTENFSEWYSEILNKAEVTDIRYGVKGFVIIRPWGTKIINKMYQIYEAALAKTKHEPVIFPAIIPEQNFKKESSHIEGFAPDVFWLDKKQGEEKLALRPTSETAFYDTYKTWIRSHRDLPLKLYQKGNVFRNETKATRPLIRSREFHWIETHDAFATKKEAEKQVQDDIVMTEQLMHKIFGVPFLPMKRPQWDKFPGAEYTVGSDSILPDGKIIQQPSTHLISQQFVKAFNINFIDEKEKEKTPWLTCYGPAMSRILASVISMHGDDNGLILPYALSPIHAVIIPFHSKNSKKINTAIEKIQTELSDNQIETKIDDSDKRPGEKFFHWEMKGVPFRIEIGEKETDAKQVTVFVRDTKEKLTLKIANLSKQIEKLSKEYDARLLARADKFFGSKITDCKDKPSIKKALDSEKIARFSFCSAENEGTECAQYIEKELQARVMGTRADKNEKATGNCPICKKKNTVVAYAGKSY